MKTKKIIYFNNAATSWPKPNLVINSVKSMLDFPFEESGRATLNCKDIIKQSRDLLCNYFNADNPNNFIFTSNATDSLNILIQGFVKNKLEQTKKKIHVITTELEHNSVLRPLKTLEVDNLISLSIVPFDSEGRVTLNSIKKVINKSTELVVMSHGSNVLGSIQDINKIGEYLSKKDIFLIVDAAQTAGLVDLDLSILDVGAVAFTGHKYLFGLPGIGFFYIKDPNKLISLKQGGTGVLSQNLFHPQSMPLKFESGTYNYPGIMSLLEGLKYLGKVKLDRIHKKIMLMTNYIITELLKENKIIVYNKHPKLPLISFNVKGINNEDVGYILSKQFGVVTRPGLHCAPLVHKRINGGEGCVRVSLSYLNSMAQCKKFISAIRSLL